MSDSRRDMFAAAALTGLIGFIYVDNPLSIDQVVSKAVKVADMMIEELDKKDFYVEENEI